MSTPKAEALFDFEPTAEVELKMQVHPYRALPYISSSRTVCISCVQYAVNTCSVRGFIAWAPSRGRDSEATPNRPLYCGNIGII